jgi:hypothetical protein
MRTIVTAAGLGGLLVLVGAAQAVAHHSFSADSTSTGQSS